MAATHPNEVIETLEKPAARAGSVAIMNMMWTGTPGDVVSTIRKSPPIPLTATLRGSYLVVVVDASGKAHSYVGGTLQTVEQRVLKEHFAVSRRRQYVNRKGRSRSSLTALYRLIEAAGSEVLWIPLFLFEKEEIGALPPLAWISEINGHLVCRSDKWFDRGPLLRG